MSCDYCERRRGANKQAEGRAAGQNDIGVRTCQKGLARPFAESHCSPMRLKGQWTFISF